MKRRGRGQGAAGEVLRGVLGGAVPDVTVHAAGQTLKVLRAAAAGERRARQVPAGLRRDPSL